MRQIVAEHARPGSETPRPCPGAGHTPAGRRHCEGKHCIERRQGLLVLWWSRDSLLTRADVLRSFEGLRELSDGDFLPLMVHLQGLTGYLADAREALMHYALSARVAMVGASPVDRVIAAFTETGFTETRYFECAMTAEAWARER